MGALPNLYPGYQAVAEQVSSEFGPRLVAITLRESHSASDNGWSAVLWDAGTRIFHRSQRYDVRLVDRIGGGDSFAAGVTTALAAGWSLEEAISLGCHCGAACLDGRGPYASQLQLSQR
jgi:2-dehydro-3-deoxygluconokinase